tara:strand:- start:1600 stop:1998 length:399 start_codon:yes stop_codon:yes gene_type:complete
MKNREMENEKLKGERRMREIVRLKLDDGFPFDEIARMLRIDIIDCKLIFANAVDGVDFASDSLSEDETRSDWDPIPKQVDNGRIVELSGSTVEILLLEIDEFARLNRSLKFETGNIRYDGVAFVIALRMERI